MHRICDICGRCVGTLEDRIVENGRAVTYVYCEACYSRALKSGINPSDEARERLKRRGKECPSCGCTVESFDESLLFGCPDCYRNMREFARDASRKLQGEHKAAASDFADRGRSTDSDGFKGAAECSAYELVRDNVISSRIRLARNVEGMVFPNRMKGADARTVELINCAERASRGVFDARVLSISGLSNNQKKVLLERHFISLALANNQENGALLIEKGEHPEISVMINEEDHLREQCVVRGHNLKHAYQRISEFDARIAHELPIAYDSSFGFLTACPTNTGTGMRASEMLFLPALKRTGAIDDALRTFKEEYGLTVRGYFGEGSDAAYDMYQISNSRTLGVTEAETIRLVEQAALRMCYCERVALEKLVREQKTSLIDGIFRSYGVLTSAYSLDAIELMKLLVDVKIGVILNVLPIKSTALLDDIIEQCASSLEIINEGLPADERGKARALIVRQALAEGK